MLYKKTGDQNSSYVDATTGPTERKHNITGLEKFTAYSVKVLAFTSKGDGAVSDNISVLTDEDGKIFKLSNVNIFVTFERPDNMSRVGPVLPRSRHFFKSNIGPNRKCHFYVFGRQKHSE